MKFVSPMLVVRNMDASVKFYKDVLDLDVVLDLGANKTLTGGLALQTLESWTAFIGTERIAFGGNCFEAYFEADDFDAFAARLEALAVACVHPVRTHSWGQRVVRFYDPDQHIIEVGENMGVVCQRFLDSGMTPEQAAARMDVPLDYVLACTRC